MSFKPGASDAMQMAHYKLTIIIYYCYFKFQSANI